MQSKFWLNRSSPKSYYYNGNFALQALITCITKREREREVPWDNSMGDTIGVPHGVTSTNTGCIILADGNKKKLVVLRSRDGKVIHW